jgi:hypothetical protein
MSDPVVAIVNRANQRGGRMLSVVDLLEAGTLSLPQAAWLLTRVLEGSSWLVGAKPGGVGKTTVMCALLAMIPPGGRVLLTNPGTEWRAARPRDTVVAYELSPGSYDAYVWGEGVRELAELGSRGCRIVANLHADTLEEARETIVGKCGADEAGLGAFEMFLPLKAARRSSLTAPRVEEILWYRGGTWRKLDRDWFGLGRTDHGSAADFDRSDGSERWHGGGDDRGSGADENGRQLEARIAAILESWRGQGVRRIEEVRARWLDCLGR